RHPDDVAFALVYQADQIRTASGRTTAAIELYRQVAADFPQSPSAAVARQRLALLDGRKGGGTMYGKVAFNVVLLCPAIAAPLRAAAPPVRPLAVGEVELELRYRTPQPESLALNQIRSLLRAVDQEHAVRYSSWNGREEKDPEGKPATIYTANELNVQ